MRHRFMPMETFLAIQMGVFGGVLLHPSELFSVNPSYTAMSMLAPEWVWAFICIMASVTLFISMLFRHKRMEILSLSAVTFIWLFIGMMFVVTFLQTGVLSTGVTYLPVAGFALWLAYKVGGTQ
jgi:hypothetical protein